MEIDSSTINKIQALMNLTDHRGATENEAASASGHVMRLLAKYNLDMAECDKIVNKPEEIESERLPQQHVPIWKGTLLQAICRAHFCAFYNSLGYRTKSQVIVGKPTNVQAVKIVYAFLCDVVESEAKAAFRAYQGYEHGKAYCNSFRIGMVQRIAARFREDMEAIHNEQVEEQKALGDGTGYNPGTPTTSVVVKNMFNEAQKEIEAYYRSIGLKLTCSGYSGRNSSGAGHSAGYEAGKNVPLHASPSLKGR